MRSQREDQLWKTLRDEYVRAFSGKDALAPQVASWSRELQQLTGLHPADIRCATYDAVDRYLLDHTGQVDRPGPAALRDLAETFRTERLPTPAVDERDREADFDMGW